MGYCGSYEYFCNFFKTLLNFSQSVSTVDYSNVIANFGTFKAELFPRQIYINIVSNYGFEIHIFGFNELVLYLYDQIEIGVVYMV